jgi:hypothetical protein
MMHVYKQKAPTTWTRVCTSYQIEVSHAAVGARAYDYRFNFTRPDRLDQLRRTYLATTWILLTRSLRNDAECYNNTVKGKSFPFSEQDSTDQLADTSFLWCHY